jgi:hypothetical protein
MTRKAITMACSVHEQASVNIKGLASDIAAVLGGQEDCGTDHFRRSCTASERDLPDHGAGDVIRRLARMHAAHSEYLLPHWRQNRARRYGVDADAMCGKSEGR